MAQTGRAASKQQRGHPCIECNHMWDAFQFPHLELLINITCLFKMSHLCKDHVYAVDCTCVDTRGGTVHRCHGSVRTSVRGSRFDTISVLYSIANLTASWYFIKIKYSEPNISAASSVSPLSFAVLLLAVIKQRCIAAGTPFWIGGELPVFIVRHHAPNRDACTVTVRDEYMYRATPSR